jgi:hypothetical protein
LLAGLVAAGVAGFVAEVLGAAGFAAVFGSGVTKGFFLSGMCFTW